MRPLAQAYQSLQVIEICRAMQMALERDLPVEEVALTTIAGIVASRKGTTVDQVVQFLDPRCTLIPPYT